MVVTASTVPDDGLPNRESVDDGVAIVFSKVFDAASDVIEHYAMIPNYGHGCPQEIALPVYVLRLR